MLKHPSVLARRSQWMRALLAVPREEVFRLAETLAERYRAAPRRVPTAGLALLRLRETVRGEAFNLGEISLSAAAVDLTDSQGRTASGAATVMVDDAHLATALAVCDGVLAAGWEQWQDVARLVEQGAAAVAREDHIRAAICERTRVDFSLLNQES